MDIIFQKDFLIYWLLQHYFYCRHQKVAPECDQYKHKKSIIFSNNIIATYMLHNLAADRAAVTMMVTLLMANVICCHY